MKIILGTVQWGLNYGISNKNGIPSISELNEILSFAKRVGIKMLDTASSYGEAEQKIGDNAKGEFDIITKIGTSSMTCSIEEELKFSLKKLKLKSVYGCLFHDVNNLLKKPSIWNEMIELKDLGLIKKIGYSLYHPDELKKLLSLDFVPDLIQIPFNLVDRRFEPYLKELKKMKTEIHARSIFLQGLLLNFEMMSERKFVNWQQIWGAYKEWLKFSELSPLEACISHVSSYGCISKLVVGIDNLLQLKQIILASKNKSVRAPESLLSNDNKLINPLSWM